MVGLIIRINGHILYFSYSGSGLLEFGEFCQLAAKFLVEEDDEALKKELKEAFRIYDKDQQGYITTGKISVSFKKGKLPIAIKF